MSSILETFYFLFKSNADDVDKGHKKAEQSTKKLDQAIDQTGDSTRETSRAVVDMAGALGKAIGSFIAFSVTQSQLQNSINLTEELRLTSMAIAENIEDIDAWGRASRRFGGDAQTLQGTLKTLNNNIRGAAFTGEGSMSPALRRLGLNLRKANGDIKSTLDLLPEIATAFERIPQPEALFLGEQLGLDQSTILLLKTGRANVEALIASQKSFGVVTKQDAELTKKFKEQLSDTSNTFLSLRQRLVMEATPGLISFFEGLENIANWLVENKTLVEGFFIATGTAIAVYFVPAMISAAAATIAATWPLLAIGAIVAGVITGFALLYDEIVAFSNGQNSLIGEAVKRWPILGWIIETLIDRFKTFFSLIGMVRDLFINLFTDPAKIVEQFGFSIDDLNKRFGFFIETAKSLYAILKSVLSPLSWISDFFGDDSVLEVAQRQIDSAFGGNAPRIFDPKTNQPLVDSEGKEIPGAFKRSTSLEGLLQSARENLNLASTTPIAAQTSNSVISNAIAGSRDTSVSIEQINIQTQATDADGISGAISQSLQSNLRSLLFNFDDGVQS